MEQWITVAEIIGTIAFSISGALIAARKQLDIFGIMVLGTTTAIGGGILRDLVLGINPPLTFQNANYAVLANVISVFVFIGYNYHLINEDLTLYNIILLIADSIGLAAFTIVGVQVAYNNCESVKIFLFLFSAVITGCGGGILRDILSGETPLVFVKHIYASASLLGAILFMAIRPYSFHLALVMGLASIVAIRLLAAINRWNLPKAKKFEN